MTQPDYEQYYDIETLKKELDQPAQLLRIQKIADKCEGSVLDIGAGLGHLGIELKKRNYAHNYLALDIKQNFVDYMNKNGLTTIKMDVLNEQDNIRMGLWDTVVVADGVEHFGDFGKVLSFANKCCKKKVLITLCRNSNDPPWHLWNINWEELNRGQWNLVEFHRLNDKGDKV